MADTRTAIPLFFSSSNPSSRRAYFNYFDIHNRLNIAYQYYFYSFFAVFQAAVAQEGIIMSNFQQHPTTPHAIFSFFIPILLSFCALKYQYLKESPFDTRPKTLYSAILSLLLYSLFITTSSSSSSSSSSSNYGDQPLRRRLHYFQYRCSLFFGYMAQACLASLLFPDSAVVPAIFYVLYVTVSVGDLLFLLFKWIIKGRRLMIRGNSTHGRHLLPL